MHNIINIMYISLSKYVSMYTEKEICILAFGYPSRDVNIFLQTNSKSVASNQRLKFTYKQMFF